MRIILYILGSLILLGALCYAATLIGIPPVWVGVIGAVILALGIMGAARTGSPGSGTSSSEGTSTVINKVE
ncbi:hypothetical protein [Luteolibacter luteus]|uniref:Uncharacterized protein n=1 Tax=Luteolibacter luteus TaxID=2728835 RepID=A0A858RBT2_9BACT|nr:hypothetical protein [Luteolibacter luteus]QJE94227.1 hypothetical protein HHL09_17240 [Luteolibacter luteus]